MKLLRRFLRFFFQHFYHEFAWSYDFVAAVVSIGRWQAWVQAILPYVKGTPVLEIGHGPGHLQISLRNRPGLIIGLDESRQMGKLAARRLNKSGIFKIDLVRGLAQNLPFTSETFAAVVSTFPAEYIFDSQTLTEVLRILRPGGRFVITPVGWIVGRATLDRLAGWLFRVTGQSPTSPVEVIRRKAETHFREAGFQVRTEVVEIRSSLILVILAEKTN